MEICNTVAPIVDAGREAAEEVIGIERCGCDSGSHDGEMSHVSRRQPSHFDADGLDLSRPVVCAATGLYDHESVTRRF